MAEDKCKDIIQRDTEYEEDQEILMEKCWYPKTKSDSRPFLIRDASFRSTLPPEPKCSIMKSSYLEPVVEEKPTLGIRKSQLLKKFQEEAEAEVAEERRPKTPVGDYRTMHDCYYQVEGFEPDDKFYMKHEDLYKKYPLYSAAAPPTTVETYKLRLNSLNRSQGVTVVKNINHPFRKYNSFSKPLNERLENSNW